MFFKIDEKNRVVLQIADKYANGFEVDNITTFRTESKPIVERGEVLYYNADTETFYTEKHEVTEEQKEKAKARATAREKRANALRWLTDNDWKVNKRMLGEWAEDDERWLTYLAERAKVRAEYDEATAALNE